MALFETGLELVIKKLFEWVSFKRRKKISDIMIDSTDVRALAIWIMRSGDMFTDFFYLLNAFNGKKKNEDRPYKFRKFVAGEHKDILVDRFDIKRHRKVPVDKEYSRMLQTLIDEGQAGFNVWKMQEGSSLRAKFIYEKLNYVRYYLIDKDDKEHELWYVIVGTQHDDGSVFDDPTHVNLMNLAIAELKAMIDSQRK